MYWIVEPISLTIAMAASVRTPLQTVHESVATDQVSRQTSDQSFTTALTQNCFYL